MLFDPVRGLRLALKVAEEARHAIRPGHLNAPAVPAFYDLHLRHDESPHDGNISSAGLH